MKRVFLLLLMIFSIHFFSQSKKELKSKGLEALNKGDFATTKDYYLKLLDKGEKTWETYTILGDCEFKLGNQEQALTYFEQASKKNPVYAGLYLRIATVLRQQKNFDKAIFNFLLMDAISPKNPQVYNMISSTYFEKGDLQEALLYANKSIEIGGENLEYIYGKSLILLKLNKIDEACSTLEKANQLDTDNGLKDIDIMIAQNCKR